MASDTIIEQRAFERRTWFGFGEDKVEFGYIDPSGEVKMSAFYEAIDLENITQVKVRAGRRYVWIAFVAAVLASLALSSFNQQALASLPMLAFVAFVFAVRFTSLFSVDVAVLSVKAGSQMQRLRILKDAKYDDVMARLKAGWTGRIRKLYATVRIGGNPAEELNRFRWLLDRKVIDEAEYQRAASLIGSAASQLTPEPRNLN